MLYTSTALVLFLSSWPVLDACLSSGVCGSSCYTPPPVSCQPQQCQPGYSCGHYGCARNRARSSLTQKNGIIAPVDVFLNSTAPKRNIFGVNRHKDTEVEQKIDYATFSKLTLQEMYFKNDACPIEAAADIQYCAAQGRDHRLCCYQNGIQKTLAGEKCLTFCDQRADVVVKLDYTYLPCYDRFELIKRCFYDDIKNRMEKELLPRLNKDA